MSRKGFERYVLRRIPNHGGCKAIILWIVVITEMTSGTLPSTAILKITVMSSEATICNFTTQLTLLIDLLHSCKTSIGIENSNHAIIFMP